MVPLLAYFLRCSKYQASTFMAPPSCFLFYCGKGFGYWYCYAFLFQPLISHMTIKRVTKHPKKFEST